MMSRTPFSSAVLSQLLQHPRRLPAGLCCGMALLLGAAPARAQLPPPTVSPPPTVQWRFDAEGHVRELTQGPSAANPLSTTIGRDRLNRESRLADRSGAEILIRRPAGPAHAVEVQDPRGLVTQLHHNGFGELLWQRSPDSGNTAIFRDTSGLAWLQQDARGAEVRHEYDGLGRPKRREASLAGHPTQVFTWAYEGPEARNQLAEHTYPNGSMRFGYNAWGQLASITQRYTTGALTSELRVEYGYGPGGELWWTLYPSGRRVWNNLDRGRVSAMSVEGGGQGAMLISQVRYLPGVSATPPVLGWLWHLDSGTQPYERAFDTYGRLVRYPLGGATRDVVFNDVGLIAAYQHRETASGAASAAARALDQAFTYDAAGRLATVQMTTQRWEYGYDGTGNRTLLRYQPPVGQLMQQVHAIDTASNRLQGQDSPPTTRAYDAAGNLHQLSTTGVVRGHAYAPSGMLAGSWVQAAGAPSLQAQMYDGWHRRVARWRPASLACAQVASPACEAPAERQQLVQFVYDPQGRLLGEYDATGRPLKEYVWFQDTPLAVLEGDVLPGQAVAQRTLYLYADHLDTPRVAIDRQGRQRWSWLSEPFGHSLPVQDPLGFGPVELNLRMPGQYHDSSTGLLYNWHRFYEAGVGRYTQSDPIGLAGGINTYMYAEGNPATKVDPQGLAACIADYSTGKIKCLSDDLTSPLELPFSSGNNNIPNCHMNSTCSLEKEVGPTPTGCYRWSGRTIGDRRILEPIEGFAKHVVPRIRDRLRTHSCENPWGPTALAGRHVCSAGCATSTEEHIRRLNKLIDAEPNSIICFKD